MHYFCCIFGTETTTKIQKFFEESLQDQVYYMVLTYF